MITRDAVHWLTRRHFLQVGGLGALGLSLPGLWQAEAIAKAAGKSGRAKSCIFLFLYGGPSHVDTWDMKPHAPAEVRGEFQPIQTTVPGVQICEHLPKTARLAQHYSIIRTLNHVNRNHNPAGGWMLTGVDPKSDNAGQLAPKPDDPPALGALAARLAPSRSGVPSFVMMPARLADQGAVFRGQAAGWLGTAYDPLHITRDPNDRNFRVDGFGAAESAGRFRQRRSLLTALDRQLGGRQPETMTALQERAFDLLTSRRGQSAFDLSAEPDSIRDRYGRNTFGQGVLLARRLIEAGVRLVTVFDCNRGGGHEWDTHGKNFPTLKNKLLPRADQAYSALLEDLRSRGLLEDTVVYLGGEFGRTPVIGQRSGTFVSPDGRDHYPSCFCGTLAGGLSRAGLVHGVSDSKGAYPSKDPVSPEDLSATLLAAMGLDPEAMVSTRDGRPMPVSHGRPVAALLK